MLLFDKFLILRTRNSYLLLFGFDFDFAFVASISSPSLMSQYFPRVMPRCVAMRLP